MPKTARPLSATQVRRITTPGLHAVGGATGLHLQVAKSGARSWILRITVSGKRRDLGLGSLTDVPLAMARERARETRDLVFQGRDPVLERKARHAAMIAERASRLTFDEAARRYLAAKTTEFRNVKHGKQWEATLTAYASPVIGALPVADVALPHIVSILEPLWQNKTETATRLRGRIEKVLSWATVSGYRTGDNPARWRGNLDAVLPQPRKIAKVQHHRAVPVDDVPAFLTGLRARDGMAAKALEFLLLTAARSGEVRGATWDEIDLKAATWTIPGERMKGGREHRVPLSGAAVALLKALPRFEGNPLVFPAARGGMLSDATMGAVLKRMKVAAVPHGFRSSFRDWAAERTAYPREVAESALAHVNGNRVEAAYLRTDMLDQRRRLMRDWASFCAKPAAKAGNVVPLRGGRA